MRCSGCVRYPQYLASFDDIQMHATPYVPHRPVRACVCELCVVRVHPSLCPWPCGRVSASSVIAMHFCVRVVHVASRHCAACMRHVTAESITREHNNV